MRTLSFAIADGAMPSNEGRGYVLRRILRRAARYARQLDQYDPFIHQLVGTLGETMGHVFPEVAARKDHIALVDPSPKRRVLAIPLTAACTSSIGSPSRVISTGSDAFQLYGTFGFPLDLTELIARERGLPLVKREEFDRALATQRQQQRQRDRDRLVRQLMSRALMSAPEMTLKRLQAAEKEAEAARKETEAAEQRYQAAKEEAEAAPQAAKEETEAAVQRRQVAKEEAEAVQAEAEAAVQRRQVVHKAAQQAAVNREAKKEESHSRFVGYDELEIDAHVVLTGRRRRRST